MKYSVTNKNGVNMISSDTQVHKAKASEYSVVVATSVVASVIFSTCFSVVGVPHVTRTLRDKVPISNKPLHLILKKPLSGKIRKSVSRKMKNVKHAMVRAQNPRSEEHTSELQ